MNRPTGVSILSVWYFLNGLSIFGGGLAPLFMPLPALPAAFAAANSIQIAVGVSGVLFGALYFAIGWGMWEGMGWARVGAMVLAGLALVAYLFGAAIFILGVNFGGGTLSFPGIGVGLLIFAIVQGLIVYYLLRPEVEDFFGGYAAGGGYGGETATDTSLGSLGTGSMNGQNQIRSVADTSGMTGGRVQQPKTEFMHQQMPASAWLVPAMGAHAGKDLVLHRQSSNRVGRDGTQADIVLDDPTVSKLHAEVRWENGQFVLYDLASTNGTFVNNHRVRRQSLLDGDDIRLGNARFVFKQVKVPQMR